VTEVPGERPKSPLMTDEPASVTVEAPSTAKLPAVPRSGAVAACTNVYTPRARTADAITKTRIIEIDFGCKKVFLFIISSDLLM